MEAVDQMSISKIPTSPGGKDTPKQGIQRQNSLPNIGKIESSASWYDNEE